MNEIYVPDTFKRLAARLIDQVLCLIFYIPVMRAVYLLLFPDEEVTMSLGLLIILGLIPALYEGLWLWLMQQTPGKWFLGLKVVDAYNPQKDLSWQQCFLRALVGRFDLLFSIAIYATAFLRYDRTHVADWFAETRVVQFYQRPKKAKIRWFLGPVFILFYGAQGVGQAVQFLKGMKLENGQVSLHSVYKNMSVPLEEMED